MSDKFKYRGNLAETPLPEMLYTIAHFRIPGIIEARLDGVIKRVYLRDGYIIHANSTDRLDSLGEYLTRLGSADAKKLEQISRERKVSSKRFGVLCVERGILSPAELFHYIRAQIEGIVWSLFYWEKGEVTFGIGELEDEEMVQIKLPIGQVVVQGIRQAPDAKPLVARLGEKETILESTYTCENLIELGLDVDEYQLLQMVDGEKSLYELCSHGPQPPAENAKMLYALQAWQLIKRHPAQQAGKGPVKIQMKTAGDQFLA